MADHLELVAEIPKVEKMSVQIRLEHAKRRRSQQLKRHERDKDKWGPLPAKRGPPVKFQPRIVLLEATSRGDTEEVRKMLDNGVDPNMANNDGLTALHQACIDDCEDLVKLFLEFGANVDATDRELWTPIHAAAACGNQEIIECLIDHGANVVAVNADENLAIDLVEEDDELIDFLQQEMSNRGFSEAKIDELLKERETTMLTDLKDVVEEKQYLDVRLEQGATPLHIAAANGYVDVVEFLLENGASVDIEDDDGWQPVHAAACWGTEEIIEVLVENGADLECQTVHGESPLELCEDDILRQFLKDLRSKVRTNKFKVKQLAEKRKRSNSRSLSVKRSSLKEKISISQSEAKAEAILRQHPQLAFLIPDDLKPKSLDMSKEGEDLQLEEIGPPSSTGQITKNMPTDDRSEERDLMKAMVVNSKEYRSAEEQSKTMVKNSYNIKVSLENLTHDVDTEKSSSLQEKKKTEIPDRSRPDNNRPAYPGCIPPRFPQDQKDGGSQNISDVSPSTSERKRILPQVPQARVVESYRSPLEERQAVPPVARPRTVLPAGPVGMRSKSDPASNGFSSKQLTQDATKVNKAPAPKHVPQQNSSPAASPPQSTKSRAAPPVPVSRSSCNTSGRVGLSDLAKDTSGYPESFQKRRSRGSREITEEEFIRVHRAAKEQKESQATSLADVKLSTETGTVKFSSSRPAPQQTGQVPLSVAATLVVDSNITTKSSSTNSNENKVGKTNADLHIERIPVQDHVEVQRHKKSCCVLM